MMQRGVLGRKILRMDKTGFLEYHMVSGCICLVGTVFFLWFCWPAVFKGMLNTGNICGMLASAMLFFYGSHISKVHQMLGNAWQKKPMRIFLVCLALVVIIGVSLVIAASAAIVGAVSKSIPQNTPAVVLGCAVKGTHPSRVLQERIDAAYAYLQEHPQAVCVLSGGKGRGEDISEAECMYRELVKAGISKERLYQEATSVNTRQNLENSKRILDDLGTVEAVTIISSEFHLYRGRWWAEKLGYENYGYAAHTDWRYLPTLFLREVIAVVSIWM